MAAVQRNVRCACLPSLRELLERLAIEAIDTVGLSADPEDALAVLVDRKDPVVLAVLLEVKRSDALAVVAVDGTAEYRHPHGPVIADHARHEGFVILLLDSAEIADAFHFPVPLRVVTLSFRCGAIDGVTVPRIAEPEFAVLVFDDRTKAEIIIPQFRVGNPGKRLPIVAADAKDRRAEPEMASAVFEYGVDVIRAVRGVGEFVTRQCRGIAGLSLGEH